jgi:hypothetical protein
MLSLPSCMRLRLTLSLELSPQERELAAKPKADSEPKARNSQKVTKIHRQKDQQGSFKRKQKKELKHTGLMTGTADSKEDEPLHDMTCIGVDTCSARSISCIKEDFLDLELTKENGNHLRGIGGTKGVAGKGCLVFYVRDLDERMKALIKAKGFYLENPPAKFRIIGQRRMKHKGLCATQDYDDAGMDISKCKRSGSILPLTEERRLLLLKTIPYCPSEELKRQLRNYVRDLKQNNSFLPHVVDLEEMTRGTDTVLIMNEANLKKENYERLLHWRFGHANSKVFRMMDLIDKVHLNEDCYCCNKAKFKKRAPFPKNEGTMIAVAEPYWRLYMDEFGGQNHWALTVWKETNEG